MIHVTEIARSKTKEGSKLSARIQCPNSDLDGKELWLRYPADCFDHLSEAADPWIALLLWPAMRLGQTLRIDAPASARLMEATDELMAIMHCWDSRFERVQIQPQSVTDHPPSDGVTASFFSGGVDAFYTLLKNRSATSPRNGTVSHLIFVHGFDIRLDDTELHDRVLSSMQRCADALGCTLVSCATNVRDVIPEGLVGWPMYYGAPLAGMALGLSGLWSRVLIPAPQTYKDTFPNGSHPVLDPLWSTEAVQMVHDGAEATRVAKVETIATSDLALRHLRVCWRNPDGAYNCGRCEKCVRTMISLKMAGALEKCMAFDQPLSYARVADLPLNTHASRVLMVQNYEAAVARQADPALIRALHRCLHPSVLRRSERAMRRALRPLALSLDRSLLAGRLRRTYHAQRHGAPAPQAATPADSPNLTTQHTQRAKMSEA